MASRSREPKSGKTEPAGIRSRAANKARAALSVITGGKGSKGPAESGAKAGAGAAPKAPRKPKRTLTPENVTEKLFNFMMAMPALALGIAKPRTSPALREKVVLGVTSVNECRYCAWGHTHWAMAHGVSLEEVNQILGHQAEKLKATNPAEAAAILFAQHYAEHHDQFDPAAIEGLRKHYSEEQIREMMAFIHAITLGNLTGNTVDAFLGRFKSHGHTHILFEGAVAALAAPVVIAILLLARLDRRVKLGGNRSR